MTVPEWLGLSLDRIETPEELWERTLWEFDFWGLQIHVYTRQFLDGRIDGNWVIEPLPVGALYYFLRHLLRERPLTHEQELVVQSLAGSAVQSVSATVSVRESYLQFERVMPFEARGSRISSEAVRAGENTECCRTH